MVDSGLRVSSYPPGGRVLMSIPGRCGSWMVVVALGVMLPHAAGATSMSTRIEKDRITILDEGVKPSE